MIYGFLIWIEQENISIYWEAFKNIKCLFPVKQYVEVDYKIVCCTFIITLGKLYFFQTENFYVIMEPDICDLHDCGRIQQGSVLTVTLTEYTNRLRWPVVKFRSYLSLLVVSRLRNITRNRCNKIGRAELLLSDRATFGNPFPVFKRQLPETDICIYSVLLFWSLRRIYVECLLFRYDPWECLLYN